MTTRPKVYVAPFGRWGSEDIAGGLVTETGEVLWEHISSNTDWLRHDLTETARRRADLEARYPDGYEVVEVEHWRKLPDHLVKILDGEGEAA